MGGQRLRQRRQVGPLVGLQVVGLNAGEVAALVPTTNYVQVFLHAAGKETGSPEEESVNQTSSLHQQQHVLLSTVLSWSRNHLTYYTYRDWARSMLTGYEDLSLSKNYDCTEFFKRYFR